MALARTPRRGRRLPHRRVTGSDEYSAITRDNLYTNLMARQNLISAADAAVRHPERAATLGVDDEETAAWRDAAARMAMPYNDTLGVHEQSAGFTSLQRWTSRRPRRRTTRSCCITPTSTCTASRS
nr:hypothetical protein [Streptomyces fodineus]